MILEHSMGWDIVFYAQFPEREDASVRFRRVWAALDGREGFESLSSLAVLDGGDPSRPRLVLSDVLQASERVTRERVESLLLGALAPKDALRGTWRTRRGSARGATTVTVFGPEAIRPDWPVVPVDLTWDLGDWRRYVESGSGSWPTVEAVMRDLAALVEIGVTSIWGVDGDKVLAPEHLFAVYHRRPEQYRDDRGPSFPSVTISEEAVRAALEVGEDRGAIETEAGPIVFHRKLGAGRLVGFYEAMRGALEFLADEQTS
jgi:hypothetical protein